MRRKKEYLIPLEKSKRVIHLDKRGRKPDRMSVVSFIFGILSGICLLYCLAIGAFMGHGTSFFMIWGALAMCFACLSFLALHTAWVQKVPRWIRGIAITFLGMVMLIFVIVECAIVSQFHASAVQGADYLIVLGAQWKEDGPSYVLQKRLDAAIEYLAQSPETKVIVSGGQGSNESISEAQGMYGYLTTAGIDPERIQMENQSINTLQNLTYSSAFFDKEKDSIVLVTNNFHMFRAIKIAQKQGYTNVQGLAAASFPGMLPNNMLREFLGVLKDFAVGNL